MPEGGQFVLCWCTDVCTTEADFNLYVGVIFIESATVVENENCTSGMVCTVAVEGYGLSSENGLAFFDGACDTGGVTDHTGGLSTHATFSLQMMGFVNTATFTFGSQSASISAPASFASYSLCWCSASCSLRSRYIEAAGNISILALHLEQSFVCYAGRTCNVAGVTSVGLSDGDQLRVPSRCTDTTNVVGFPNSGVSFGATEDGTTFSWRAATITSVLQVLALCWCSNLNTCTSSDFVTDVGVLTVSGPNSGHRMFRNRGQESLFDGVAGINLPNGERAMVMSRSGNFATRSPADY